MKKTAISAENEIHPLLSFSNPLSITPIKAVKKSKFNRYALATGLVASVLLLTNCSKEAEEVAPQASVAIPNEATARVASQPVAAASPLAEEVDEKLANLYFPRPSLANARTSFGGTTDYVDFNDEQAIDLVPDQAYHTFATFPFYIQQVGNAWINVKENNGTNYFPAFRTDYGHYHLSYQNINNVCYPPYPVNFPVGKQSGKDCIEVDPVKQPRTLNTHDGKQWIKIFAYDYNNPERVFDLLGITVTDGPIQLWFKQQNGGWKHWSSLATGKWNTTSHATGITEVLISGTSALKIGIDDIKVKIPY